MSWIVLASGRFNNGEKVPDVIGPFMSPEAAHRCVARLHNLAMPGSAFGVQISEMVPPTTAYARAATGTDLAYGGRAMDQWVYDGAEGLPVVTARNLSVAKLDADGKPMESTRRWA